ncbi:hypothetical protein FDUTEX481_08298 [Tolypothrix sp. PCC 7601]|nr:hypothetical protein FDUTEX481_08298 [Tolypothrix sp. PCC 7601]
MGISPSSSSSPFHLYASVKLIWKLPTFFTLVQTRFIASLRLFDL